VAYCPNCGHLIDAAAVKCDRCTASFGPGSAWEPLEAPPDTSRDSKPSRIPAFMDRPLKIAGIIFLSLLAAVAIGAAIFLPQVLSLRADGTAYVEQNLPAIVAGWNPVELEKRAKRLTAEEKEDLRNFFRTFQPSAN
jgi:hypothetical protein